MRLGSTALATERVERRLAAILAADVAGYSRLMGADEEGTHERLKAHLRQLIDPKINQHRGRTVKNTGDGMLVEFGSVVDAVRCAVKIQRGMIDRNADIPEDKHLSFRIGVNLGDVIVEPEDIFGDGVNIAARLEALAEPGGICISRTVYDHIGERLPYSFEDVGEQSVKNIARPVHVYRIRLDAEPMALRVGASDAVSKSPLSLPDKPSIAVLPFTNMSADPEQEFFADGIAEDIITALSRYPSLFVIARSSSFAFKGRAVDVKQVGDELGVRYVLEGGVRRAGNRIRISAQLVDADTGNHIWAERYDRDLADIFALQDDITEAVTIAVAPAIRDAELRRAVRKPTGNLDAWAAYQRGLWHLLKNNPDDNILAQGFFQQAIDLDLTFAGGYRGLALAFLQEASRSRTASPPDRRNSAESLARQAIALDGTDAEAHATLSNALRGRGDYDGALAEAERALALSPNLASAHGVFGATLIFSGHPREGLVALERSIRLDPHAADLAAQGYRLNTLALGHYFCGEYEAAVEAAKRAIRSDPNYPNAYRWLAAALGQLGRSAEAKEALEKAMAVGPVSFDMYVRQRVPWHRPEDYAHTLEGLRKAGWQG
jgi:adenylate cyclase